MIIKIIANLACSFIGTIAYAVMFQVPRRFYIGCGITGSVGWTVSYTHLKQIAAAQTSMVPYIAAGIFYYVFNLLVAMIMEKIEEKLNYYH